MVVQLLEMRFINLYFPGSINTLLLSVRVKIITVFKLFSLEISPVFLSSKMRMKIH